MRFFQCLFIASTIGLSWLAMQIVHEAGHVLHAALSGGTVTRVVLHPLVVSRTDVEPNPHPLFERAGGAMWGCLIPLFIFVIVRYVAPKHVYLAAFFAGFCLIANGAYIGSGAFMPVGDARDLVHHGAEKWHLAIFGLVTTAGGIWLMHGLGKHFGLGTAGHVDRRTAVGVFLALTAVVAIELAF